MNPASIIMQASVDGVNLTLSPSGSIKATGDQEAITRWLEIIREHKHGIISTMRGADLPEPENDTRHFRWLIHFPDRDPVETTCLPEPTHAEVLAMYPDATAAEPMPERNTTTVTPNVTAELRALVAAVGVAYGFTHAEQQEALNLALWDVEVALQSYRAMAAEQSFDDRRHGMERWPGLIQKGGE